MRLSDMWRMNLGFDFHIDVVLPVKLNTPNAREYMIDVMRKFKRDLEREMQGRHKRSTDPIVRQDDQSDSRTSCMNLYEIKSQQPLILSGSDFTCHFQGLYDYGPAGGAGYA